VRPDEHGFDGFVASRYARLVRAARLMGPDPNQAEDLVQSALMRTLHGWDSFSDPAVAWSYTYTTLVRLVQRSARRRWRGERPAAILPEPPAADAFRAVDDADLMRRALARLPHEQRTVIVLRYYVDLSEADTAAVLKCAVGTVKSRTNRALGALRADGLLSMTIEEPADG
jgi:RNA polymerase sigma-70 factor (sigma-E family)